MSRTGREHIGESLLNALSGPTADGRARLRDRPTVRRRSLGREPHALRRGAVAESGAASREIPSTMRALRKTAPGPGAELVEIPVPEPGPGEVLLRVAAASICGTDLHIKGWDDWEAGRIKNLPLTFGHEVAGHVEAVGPEVHHLALGTFVSVETHLFCGYCPMCRTGRAHICENLRILGVDVNGAFADFV